MSVTCGLLLVFALPGTKTLSTAKHSISPAIDITLGVLILVIVFVVATGRDRRRQAWSERRREKKKDKPPPRWKRTFARRASYSSRRRDFLPSPGSGAPMRIDVLPTPWRP
jgi:hypothetical protein